MKYTGVTLLVRLLHSQQRHALHRVRDRFMLWARCDRVVCANVSLLLVLGLVVERLPYIACTHIDHRHSATWMYAPHTCNLPRRAHQHLCEHTHAHNVTGTLCASQVATNLIPTSAFFHTTYYSHLSIRIFLLLCFCCWLPLRPPSFINSSYILWILFARPVRAVEISNIDFQWQWKQIRKQFSLKKKNNCFLLLFERNNIHRLAELSQSHRVRP